MISAAKKKDVLIEPRFQSDKIAGGLLYMPQQARERCTTGIVKYIGSAVTEVAIGDFVSFSGYSGTLARIAGELLIILPEDKIDFKFDLSQEEFEIYERRMLSGDEISWLCAEIQGIIREKYPFVEMHESVIKKILATVITEGPFRKLKYREIFKNVVDTLKEKKELNALSRSKEDDQRQF